jgi:hypothetical protein
MAKELVKFRCTVNTISPGAATRMTIPLTEARGASVDPSDVTRGPQQIAPVVTWLASEAARDVNSQILHVARGTVGIMQQPAVIRAFKSEALWSLAQLDAIMPKLLEAKTDNDARARERGVAEAIAPHGSAAR